MIYINSVQVQLRQWLYNHGDECPWNTGGWMKCAVSTYQHTVYNSTPSVIATVDFYADRVELRCSGIVSPTMKWPDKIKYFYRGGFTIQASIGTKNELIKDISLYTKLKTTTSNGLSGIFRVGNPNDANTSTNTATILFSGSANDMDISISSVCPYLVLGAHYTVASIADQPYTNPGTLNVIYDSDITEVYLV